MFIRNESFREFIRYYPIVTTLIMIHISLFLLMALPTALGSFFFEKFVGINLFIANGELWRLVTPIFAHKHFTHMLFNSFSLVLFGPALERMLGKLKFSFVYLICGLIANVATFIIKPLTYVHLGASGAIFGLFGFYIAMIVFQKNRLSHENKQIILTITVIGLIMTFLQANINVTAHITGMIAGFIIGRIFIAMGIFSNS